LKICRLTINITGSRVHSVFQYDITKSLRQSTLFGIIYDKVRENIFVPRKGVADDTLSNALADSRLVHR
jgi:hypothetical protein